MTDAKTRQCAYCGERFTLALRQGRNSRRARAGQERSYQDQRYCSATHRKLASKARRTRSETPVTGPITRVRTPVKASEGTIPSSGVTTAPKLVDLRAVSGASKSTLQMDFDGFRVVPDPDWPAMYRVRRPDGTITDMVNLTRARDAARHFADQERHQEPLAEAA